MKAQVRNDEKDFPLIPKPVSLKLLEGKFLLSSKAIIVISDNVSKSDAEVFNFQLEKILGYKLRILSPRKSTSNDIIHILRDKHLSPGGYEVVINKTEIFIRGNDAGVFYGLQTLLQLITPAKSPGIIATIPCCEIKDAPRYPWRGMHLDVCRHFFPKEFIKKYIDLIALYKMNTFHWHLTDDQGWRIEIKKYRKLAKEGAWRNGSMIGTYSARQFDTIRYGGFYSQDDIREIVEHATKRHVTVVPEIEMPGHCLAALAAYPQYSCTGGPFEVAKRWGVFDDVFCAGNDSTFIFLESILGEVCELFPGQYIHIGGDECPKVRWKNCEKCRKRIHDEHLEDENELQSYFIGRIEKFLKSNGKQMIGWDEILEGGLPADAAVMSWRGTEGGIAAAKKHHDVVMTPGSHCYFDHYQGNQNNEPLAIGGYTTVEKVYSFEPTPQELNGDEQKYILGAQGNVWTEYIPTPQHVEYMAVPRMCALAEVLWTPKEMKDSLDFQHRLISHFGLLDRLHVNYSKSIYELKTSLKPLPDQNGISFKLSSPFNSGKIVYTLDGSNPNVNSSLYSSPFTINKSSTVKAAYFEDGRAKGTILSQEFFISKSTGKKIVLETLPHENYFCDGAQSLVDGMKGDLNKHGQNWLGWWGKDMVATVDLGRKESFSKISMDVYDDEPAWIYLPAVIEVFASDDGINFTILRKISAKEIKDAKEVIELNAGDQSARYIKITAKNAGKIPDGKQGSGNDSWLFVDEISVE